MTRFVAVAVFQTGRQADLFSLVVSTDLIDLAVASNSKVRCALAFRWGCLADLTEAWWQTLVVLAQWLATLCGAPLGALRVPLLAAAARVDVDPRLRQGALIEAACVALVELSPRVLRKCWVTREGRLPTPLLALAAAVRGAHRCVPVVWCLG